MRVLETERLVLRHVEATDAEFILRLLNEPSFIQNIGDRGVRNTDDAVGYIENGPRASYERFGFGLFLVELKGSGKALGICGLLKRDALDDPDIGFAFLPEFWSKGYAYEAAVGTITWADNTFGIQQLAAITSPNNEKSIRLLEKLGFKFERMMSLTDGEPEVRLFLKSA
jgi:RimJ/RimL family protein N-acetyltransferase